MNFKKYHPEAMFQYPQRTWPNKQMTKAPMWCSVDLRDGNQALEKPMTLDQKIAFFKFLVGMGFKEIEVGFPAASETEFQFTRTLIEKNLIPDDVTIQVLTQARDHIITRTFESIKGAKKAVVHLYNSTSTLQRDVVFDMSKDEIKNIAIKGAQLFVQLASELTGEQLTFEYTPESFTGTEMDYAAEVCNAVIDVWQPTPTHKVIINLPSTVEMTTANVYADQIEYMSNHLNKRDSVIVCVHAHNDRGTGVASSELAVLAGAERVEGTLFGNGERTGNADLLNLAMNLYVQGIDPALDFSNMDEMVAIYEQSTGLPVHPRHPYAGELVFTAFSGSHQDAIKKGMAKMKDPQNHWAVPYLPIDPKDIGRTYAPIIRINSQSGKGGVAFILENGFGLLVPKAMQQDFSKTVTHFSDTNNKELMPQPLYDLFDSTYVNLEAPVALKSYNETANGEISVSAIVMVNGQEKTITDHGNGLLSAFSNGLIQLLGIDFEIVNYTEHSLEHGKGSRAITYMQIADENGQSFFGAGVSSSISKSSLKAVVSAINRMMMAHL